MEKVTKWIILIWHQASDANAFYVLDNGETEAAQLFDTEREAREYWKKNDLDRIHAGIIVQVIGRDVEYI